MQAWTVQSCPVVPPGCSANSSTLGLIWNSYHSIPLANSVQPAILDAIKDECDCRHASILLRENHTRLEFCPVYATEHIPRSVASSIISLTASQPHWWADISRARTSSLLSTKRRTTSARCTCSPHGICTRHCHSIASVGLRSFNLTNAKPHVNNESITAGWVDVV